MTNLSNDYNKYGYVILRNILSIDEVNDLRRFILNNFDEKNTRQILAREIIKHEKIYSIFFKKKLVDACKSIMNDKYYLIPDFQIMMNLFGAKINSYKPSWHTDSNSEGISKYLISDKYKFAKIGFYLQENSNEYGGGISIMPKGHKFYLNFLPWKIRFLLKKIINRLTINFLHKFVDTKPGDVIIFDSRIPHASSLPKLYTKTLKDNKLADKIHLNVEKSKFAIYCNLTDKLNYKSFLNNSLKRYESRLRNQEVENENEFFDYTNLSYPKDFPEQFVNLCKKNNIKIATLDD